MGLCADYRKYSVDVAETVIDYAVEMVQRIGISFKNAVAKAETLSTIINGTQWEWDQCTFFASRYMEYKLVRDLRLEPMDQPGTWTWIAADKITNLNYRCDPSPSSGHISELRFCCTGFIGTSQRTGNFIRKSKIFLNLCQY